MEVYGGRGGGVGSVVGGVEVCGRAGGVWEGWRSVVGGWKSVVGRVRCVVGGENVSEGGVDFGKE